MTAETRAPGVPELDAAPVSSAAVESDGYADDAEYSHLADALTAYGEVDSHSPRRDRLWDELVAGYLPVAHHIAQRYANRGESLEDLKQVACLGLVGALNRYKPELSRNFLGYAIPTITGEIRRHFRDRTWSMRVPRRLKELNQDVTQAAREMTQELGRAPRPSELAATLRVPIDDVLEALEGGTGVSRRVVGPGADPGGWRDDTG